MRNSFIVYDELLGLKNRPGFFKPESLFVIYMWGAWGGSDLNTGTGKEGDERPVKDYSELPPLEYMSNEGYVDDSGNLRRGGYGNTFGLDPDYDGLIVIDIESWPSYTQKDLEHAMRGELSAPPKTLEETIKKIEAVISTLRRTYPHAKIGWYNLTSGGRTVSSFPKVNALELEGWRRMNDFYTKVISNLDVMVPSVYLSRTLGDRKTIITFREYLDKLDLIVKEQRRLAPNKPVIGFVSPHIMDDYPKLIPIDEWRAAINFYRRVFDGVILWSKPDPKYNFDLIETHLELFYGHLSPPRNLKLEPMRSGK